MSKVWTVTIKTSYTDNWH